MSPFLVIATADDHGNCEVSPRGDAPGFVRVVDDTRIQIPDRIGNNRADSGLNIVSNGKAAVIFFVPGLGETLRIRGPIRILVDEELRATFTAHGKDPRAVLELEIERLFFQCQKAIIRSKLWDGQTQIDRERQGIPNLGRIFSDQIEDLSQDRAEHLVEDSIAKRMW